MLEALKVAQKGLKEMLGNEQKVISKAAKEKLSWTKDAPDEALVKRVVELAEAEMAKVINAKDKHARAANAEALKQRTLQALAAEFPEATSADREPDRGHRVSRDAGPGAGEG